MSMGHRPLKQIIFIVSLLLFSIDGLIPKSQAIEGNIDDVAKAILTYFPKVSGRVTGIDEDRVDVDLGAGQGLSEGVLLTVFREGEIFYHPVTDVPLGRFESVVATIEAIRFSPPRLTAKRIKAVKGIEVGDLVRLPSTKIPLSISMKSGKDHAFLMSELASALSDTGRFDVESLSPGTDSKTAFGGGDHYYIELATALEKERFSMNLQIQNTVTGKQIANIDVLIHQSEESDLILEHLQFQLFEQRQKK